MSDLMHPWNLLWTIYREFDVEDHKGIITIPEEEADKVVEERRNNGPEVSLSEKTNGKNGLYRRETGKSNSSVTKKSEKTVVMTEPQRRTRPKKAPNGSSSNPYEFYYYTGFGPRWGKQRGKEYNGSHDNMVENAEDEQEPSPVMLSRFDEDEDDDDDEEEEEIGVKRKKARKPVKERSLKSLM